MNAKEYLIRKSGRKFGTLKQEWRFQTLDQLVEYLDEYHQAKLKDELPTEEEMENMFDSLIADVNKLHSGNVAHQKTHLLGTLTWWKEKLIAS